jgi:hypothetical protein
MTTHEMSAIGAQPFLRGLPARQLAELAGLGRHVVVPAGQRRLQATRARLLTACASAPSE